MSYQLVIREESVPESSEEFLAACQSAIMAALQEMDILKTS